MCVFVFEVTNFRVESYKAVSLFFFCEGILSVVVNEVCLRVFPLFELLRLLIVLCVLDEFVLYSGVSVKTIVSCLFFRYFDIYCVVNLSCGWLYVE